MKLYDDDLLKVELEVPPVVSRGGSELSRIEIWSPRTASSSTSNDDCLFHFWVPERRFSTEIFTSPDIRIPGTFRTFYRKGIENFESNPCVPDLLKIYAVPTFTTVPVDKSATW